MRKIVIYYKPCERSERWKKRPRPWFLFGFQTDLITEAISTSCARLVHLCGLGPKENPASEWRLLSDGANGKFEIFKGKPGGISNFRNKNEKYGSLNRGDQSLITYRFLINRVRDCHAFHNFKAMNKAVTSIFSVFLREHLIISGKFLRFRQGPLYLLGSTTT